MKLKTLLIAVTLATLPAAALAADQPAGKAKGAAAKGAPAKAGKPATKLGGGDDLDGATARKSKAAGAPAGKAGKPTTGVLPDDRVLAKQPGKSAAK